MERRINDPDPENYLEPPLVETQLKWKHVPIKGTKLCLVEDMIFPLVIHNVACGNICNNSLASLMISYSLWLTSPRLIKLLKEILNLSAIWQCLWSTGCQLSSLFWTAASSLGDFCQDAAYYFKGYKQQSFCSTGAPQEAFSLQTNEGASHSKFVEPWWIMRIY